MKGSLKVLRRSLHGKRYCYTYKEIEVYFARFGKDWYIDFTCPTRAPGSPKIKQYSFRFTKRSLICSMIKNIERIIDIVIEDKAKCAVLIANPACVKAAYI